MQGLYIHIPFCRQACRYCDFYFTVSLRYLDELLERIIEELEMKGLAGGDGRMESLYVGGGTPSLLSPSHLDRLFAAVRRRFSFTDDPEITLECNPDDLDGDTLKALYRSGINRLSIGVQSFHDRDLKLMRRSHSARQAMQSIGKAVETGFENISVDLIYGIPDQTPEEWEQNLKKVFSLPVTHFSAYHLTFEPGTVFDHWRRKGKITPVDEETSIRQYSMLRELSSERGFDHYEISNLARARKYSRHNLLYWSGKPYLGIGPSAHSYDGINRSWNVASVKKYIDAVRMQAPFSESERLTEKDRYHDMLITALRTRWGMDLLELENRAGKQYSQYFTHKAEPLLNKGYLRKEGNHLVIPPDHWLIADHLLKELFVETE